MRLNDILRLLAVASLTFIASCKTISEPIIFSSNDAPPLPESFIAISLKQENDGIAAVQTPVVTRISSNQYQIVEDGKETVISFEPLQSDSNYWIAQLPIYGDTLGLVLVRFSDEAIFVVMPTGLDFSKGQITNREQMHDFFGEWAGLNKDELIEFPYFLFDNTQPDPQGALLNERIAEALIEGEPFLLELEALEEANKARAREEEAERQAQEEAERLAQEEAERQAQEEAADERQRLLAEQNEAAAGKEAKVISFSDGTELAFCISESTIKSSVQAASEQSYLTFMNRLASLREERLCTERLSMQNIEEMTVAVELWEADLDTGRIFMIGSIPRSYFNTCPPCDNLRPSDRMYFVTYNEVGGDQYGWKGYEQFIVENRTIGGILDFLLTE